MPVSNRARSLPPYIFAKIHADIRLLEQQGHQVIDLGISDPDRPPRQDIQDALCDHVRHPDSHRYPTYRGVAPLRQAIADWYQRRFGVHVDPDSEVLVTVGSKEALIHIALATVNPGQAILVPDPGYPSYQMPTALFGFESIPMPLLSTNQFLPDLDRLTPDELRRTQLGFFNYPNNPTGATAPHEFWDQVVALAHRHQWTVVSDLAYVDIVYDGRAHSIFEHPGAKEVALETLTFSKSYSMQGFRLAAVVGNPELLEAVYRVESQINAGVYLPIQYAGVTALQEDIRPEMLESYRIRRDLVVTTLQQKGFDINPPPATLYVWLAVKPPTTGEVFAQELLHRHGVAVAPGIAFGSVGHNFIRISLTQPYDVLVQALEKWPPLKE